MKEKLVLYRDRLTDLTAKNSSLRLMRLANKNHCDLRSFSVIEEGVGERILADVCNMKSQIPLLPYNSFEEEEVLLNRRLTQLKREIDLIEQETGMNTFYVAYGFLEGYLVDDFFLRSPLLFYPAKFTRSNRNGLAYWVLEIDEEAAPFINRTFLLAAQKYLGVTIADQIAEDLGQLPKNALEVYDFLYDTLKKYGIKLEKEDAVRIASFKPMKKDDVPRSTNGFILRPYAVMGKFQQSQSTLLQDYDYLVEHLPEEGLLHELFHGSEEQDLRDVDTEELNRVKEEDTFFVLDTDASQEAVVVAARERKGLIVHGPPGTGKSQVIVNLIADRLAQGQRVLLVCQKPTALEVVYNRLGQIELHKHVAFVADFNKSKSNVYGKIASVIERSMPEQGPDLLRISNEMQSLATRLNNVAQSLHGEREFGRSLFYLYNHTKWDQQLLIEVDDLLEGVTYESLTEHLVDLRTVFQLMQKYDHPNYPWVKRKSFATMTGANHLALTNLFTQMVKDLQQGIDIRNQLELSYPPQYYLENRESLHGVERSLHIIQNRNMFKHVLMFYRDEEREFENEAQFSRVKQTYGALRKQIDLLTSRAEPVTNLTEDEAKRWNDKITQFLELNQKVTRFFSGAWYSLKKELQGHCKAHQVAFDGTSVRQYQEKIGSFLLFEKLRKDAEKLHFYSDAPTVNDIEEWVKWINLKNRALEFLELYVAAQTVFPKWLQNPQSADDLQGLLQPDFEHHVKTALQTAQITERLQTSMGQLRTYLDESEVAGFLKEIHHGLYDLPKFQGMLETLDSFDSLSRLDQMKNEMNEFRKKLIDRCQAKSPIEQTPDVIEKWSLLIENSFLHAWILKVEEQEPHVKDVSTEIYQDQLQRYRSLIKEKRNKVPGLIDTRLAKRSTDVQGNPRKTLKHESNKRRKQASLRQVMSSFTDDLLKLIPCWLCTPEAVSAIFPMIPDIFDLVIFDEASQCTVENAIPAIYRGKQVVIAGDEKQLPPSSFFKGSSDDGEEFEEEEDHSVYVDKTDTQAVSLLEWAKPRFADQWLAWHYRSQYEELINFSNYAFYGKRMQIAPSLSKNSTVRPIEFLSVDGKWLNQQNQVEAEKIVDQVFEILKTDETHPTLGIITFNSKQADLINDVFEMRVKDNPSLQVLLEEARSRKNGDQQVGLFVKNIENVQGDERDIILFSVAYAKNEEGKMVSNFGALSNQGGENRLNVAITRAKKKVYIVCSFNPTEWTRAETYATGVRLLKKYLEYGKAVSEGQSELVKSILEGILDPTAVQDLENQVIYDSPFEEQVRTALVKRNFTVHTQIGFSGYRIDLGIVHPDTKENYILGIECDGAMYHSSKVARERDLYRQRFLESQGWKIHRIWSRNWWKARDKEIEKIEAVVVEILEKSSPQQTIGNK